MNVKLILVLLMFGFVSECLADLEFKSVMPEKIFCHPDEMVGMEVEVINPDLKV